MLVSRVIEQYIGKRPESRGVMFWVEVMTGQNGLLWE